ncbi:MULTISPECIES: TolC family protein [Chryseobacterium]|uniref:Outer membrane protein n=1 Tax=Chryseobacterium camelliae TaxID=1265445 RepID=A0ABU0TIC1_9FLAO|nr:MULTISPECIES: TolC family protein [Chryseobacterium]MDT3406302.1 outer membrane protein [Pseudacidovorax intermedius]MDQ1095898.1 outer membrane protein [Chryseobacterium camelliae]MDQ1099836.1 outer membrane protein [Chryseobacterium sp. SORGH_AS_1048]MDR6087181.1 outer membrane protein [Chryseobacterium sp. SORGH_AS_0909]MDR6131555.1 outer membrane protein [Chryseobacterium sp. SORGH_AS_1175]
MKIIYDTISKIVMVLMFTAAIGSQAQERVVSVDEVKNLALQNNKKIKKAQQNIEAAKAARTAAETGGKPTLDGSAGGYYISKPLSNLVPEVIGSANLNATQVLYAGGKVETGKKISSAAVDLQMAQKDLTKEEVKLSAESMYWQIVNAKEKIALAKEYIKLLDQLHTNVKNSFDAGLTYKNDLLKIEVQQNEAQLNLKRAEDGLSITKLNLAQITGLPNSDFDVEDSVSGSFNGILADNQVQPTNRPELSILAKAVEMNELQEKLLDGDRKPTVALSGIGFTSFGKNINPVNLKNNMQGFIGMLSVSIPIYDWGARKEKVKEQQYKTNAQKLEMEETSELLVLELQNAVMQLNQSVKRIELAEKSLVQATENLRLNQDRYDAGTVLAEEVLKAQVLWQEAKSEILDAKAEYKINEAKYKKASGTNVEY